MRHPAARIPLLALVLLGGWLLLGAGCASIGGGRPPARTTVLDRTSVLPAQVISNLFIVEARQADGRTARFLIDTGSSVTLVSPALARSLRIKEKGGQARTVNIRGAHNGEMELEACTLRSLTLGTASFEQVPALVYDCSELSAHLGLPLDGIIGFPLFRDTLLTLDYPGSRLVLAPSHALAQPPAQSPRVSTIAFNNEQNSPLIPIQMGNESFIVLVDSGSDGALSLNPVGLHPRFAHGPRVGQLVTSLNWEHRQLVGRLAQNIIVGTHTVEQPVTDLTEQLSSLGGEFLRNFVLTFDQRNNRVTFARTTDDPIRMGPRRNTGLSFGRTPAYWRVLAIVPETPAAQAAVQPGDLCVGINGEPVEKWGAERYAALLRTAVRITYTFLHGPKETDLDIPVIDLVP